MPHEFRVTDGVETFVVPFSARDVSGSVIWVRVATKPELGSRDSSLIFDRGNMPDLSGRFVAPVPRSTSEFAASSGQMFLPAAEGGWLTHWRYD